MLEKDIPFILERSKKRRRSIALLICPKRGLVVQVPHRTTDAHIRAVIVERQDWIEKKLQALQEQHQQPECQWTTGDFLPFLGEQLSLEVWPIAAAKNQCEQLEQTLLVRLTARARSAAPLHTKKIVEAWLRRQAKHILEERTAHFAELLQVKPSAIVVKTQKTRWGSCDRHDKIRYNWRIVMAAPDLLDYLVVHELAHIKEKNHSAAFWQVVESILPDYQARRKALKAFHPPH